MTATLFFMKRLLFCTALLTSLFVSTIHAQTTPAPASAQNAAAAKGSPKKKAPPPPITATPTELAKIREKTTQLDALVQELKRTSAAPELVTDVAIYAHAGRMLLEYPDMFTNQGAIDRAFTTLDQGIERARQLQARQPQWTQ